jgi:hypothetical protein
MKNMKNEEVKEGLKLFDLENKINKQSEEILGLKDLVLKLAEKITRDVETEEKKKNSGVDYWTIDLNPCNKNNFYVCAVCEKVPKRVCHLRIKTCSPHCANIIAHTITLRPDPDKETKT